MRCVDCYFFNTSVWAGREMQSCENRGELAQNAICNNFRHKDEPEAEGEILHKIALPPEAQKTADAVGALAKGDYKKVFHEILAESFVLEQDANAALEGARAQLQVTGARVQLDGTAYRKYADRLVELWTLHRIVMATGMGHYADVIMQREIENRFPPPTPARKAKT